MQPLQPISICRRCGRVLTDPVSIALGVGPVCRLRAKNFEYKMKNKTNLFGEGVDYSYGVTNGVLHITDNNGPVSVTNAMERVLIEIWGSVDIVAMPVIYRDSQGIWDGVHFATTIEGDRKSISGVRFYSINETELEKALEKARLPKTFSQRQLGKKDELSIEEYKQAVAEKYDRLERGGSSKKPHHNRAYKKRKKPGKKTHRKKRK